MRASLQGSWCNEDAHTRPSSGGGGGNVSNPNGPDRADGVYVLNIY
jgi:hypothetical protein